MTDFYTSILNNFSQKTILIIGDVMLDEYHWCDVSRISPEAPVPVCRVKKTTHVPGGAANVAYNLATLGCTPHLIGLIGQDNSGNRLKKLLSTLKINITGLIQDGDTSTILKSRIVAGQQHVVRVDRETDRDITKKQETALFNYVKKNVKQWDAILLSDYLKGTLTSSFLKRVIALATSHDIPVVVDPKGDNYAKYKGATILTPNFKEFTEIAKKRCTDEKQVLQEAMKIIKRLHLKSLLVTRSEKGMSLIDTQRAKHDIPTRAREVFDITGAGDTVISVLTAAIASGCSLLDASHLANMAAGIVVAKIGTSTVTIDEIQAEIQTLGD